MGLEVVAAARYFMLSPCVEHIVEELVLEHVKNAGKDLRQAAVMLSLAVEYKASHLELVRELAHLLRRAWMNRDYGSHLSEEALHLLLRRTKNADVTDMNRIKPSLNEFFCFRGVLMWALCQSGLIPSNNAQSLFDQVIPYAKENLYRLRCTEKSPTELEWLPGYEVDRANNEILDMLQAHQVCKEAAVRLLANIDWVQIPPQLVTRIVEPLKLVSDCQLMNLFRYYYIDRPISVHLSWIHGSQLVQSWQGFCIQSREDSMAGCKASAVCELQSCPDEKLYIWTFKVERLRGLLSLGLLFWQDKAEIKSWHFDDYILWNMKSANAVHMLPGHLSKGSEDGVTLLVRGPDQVWQPPTKSPTVEFCYDRDACQCLVKVDSLDLGPVFKDLPCQSFFPALSMCDSSVVTIAVHGGFDVVCNCSARQSFKW